MHDERVIRRRHGSGLPRAVALAVALAVLGAGCASSAARARGSAEVLRLGVFATLSHAPAIVGIASGIFARELAPTRVEVHVFGSGVDAGVALLAGSIDAAYLGPWPAVSLFVRSGKVAVVSGAALGGASLIVRRGIGIASREDLRGRKVAVPAIGNSQDLALRTWLHGGGLRATDEGGDVSITEVESPRLLQLFRAGRLDGAWAPEPYATWLVRAGVADELVNESSLWPGGRFPSAVLVVSAGYLDAHPGVVERLVRANVDSIRFLREFPEIAKSELERALVRDGAPALPARVIAAAWRRVTFTWDPLPSALESVARDAAALGILSLPPRGLAGLERLDALESVLDDEGLPPLEIGTTMGST